MAIKYRELPCSCGWKFEGFHICVDLSVPGPKFEQGKDGSWRRTGKHTAEARKKMSEAQKRRWRQQRADNASRDAKIVAEYAEGDVSIRGLARKHGTSHTQVMRILHLAQEDGLVTVRKPGTPLKKKV